MASKKERIPGSNESLIFNTAKEAREFTNRIEGKIQKENRGEVKRKKEIMSEEVAYEIEKEGIEAVDTSHPWEHSPEEHKEVQKLVEVAFRENLSLALKKARQSDNYPRIIDLFHDVLTGEMYEALVKAEVNKQKMSKWLWLMVGVASLLLIMALSVMFF